MIKNSLISKYNNVFLLLSLKTKSITPVIYKNCFSTKPYNNDKPPELKPFYPNNKSNNKSNNHNNNKSNNNNNSNIEVPQNFFRSNTDREIPDFLSKKVFKIITNIINSKDIKFIKEELWVLHLLKIRHYLKMYSIIQKVFENIENSTTMFIENQSSEKEKLLEQLMDYLFSKNEFQDDLVNCYFYSMVNEKNKMVIETFENVLNRQEYRKKDFITNETIKVLLEFRRIDLALKVYQSRFNKYNIGVNIDTVIIFSNYFNSKQKYKWAMIWGNQNRKQSEEKNNKRLNKKTQSTLDSYSRLEMIYKEIYSFITNELPSTIPNTQPDPIKGPHTDKYSEEYRNAQKQLNLSLLRQDATGLAKVLDDYFFKYDQIPHSNTLLISLQVISDFYRIGWDQQFKYLPKYINDIINFGKNSQQQQKQKEQKVPLKEQEKDQQEKDQQEKDQQEKDQQEKDQQEKDQQEEKELSNVEEQQNEKENEEYLNNDLVPNENELIEIFKQLLVQPKFEYPIRLFKMISNLNIKVKFTDMTINHYLSYLKFYYHEINESDLIETVLEDLQNYSTSVGYNNLLLYHLFEKFKTIEKSESEEYQATLDSLLEFYYKIPRKNYATFDIALSIVEFKCPVAKNYKEAFSYWDKLIMNASISDQNNLLHNRIVNYLADFNHLDAIEKFISNDPFIWKELHSSVLIKYFSLYRRSGDTKKILSKFIERNLFNYHCPPDLFEFISFVNRNIKDETISNILYINAKKSELTKQKHSDQNNGSTVLVKDGEGGDSIFIYDPLNQYYYQQNREPFTPLQIDNLEKILSIKNYNPGTKL
ncbi:hypothetical protein ACTFIU_007535 [Dictyostelium citrinum]